MHSDHEAAILFAMALTVVIAPITAIALFIHSGVGHHVQTLSVDQYIAQCRAIKDADTREDCMSQLVGGLVRSQP